MVWWIKTISWSFHLIFYSHSLLLPQRWGNLWKKDLKYWNTTLPASSEIYSHNFFFALRILQYNPGKSNFEGRWKTVWVRGNLSYPAKFQWNFDLGKENLVPVSGEFELSEFRVIDVLLYHLPGMLSSESGVRGWAGGGGTYKMAMSVDPAMDLFVDPVHGLPLWTTLNFWRWILVNCSQFILSGLLSFSFTHPFKFSWIPYMD